MLRGRKLTYLVFFLLLFLLGLALKDSTWQGSMQLHTLMEAIATVLALNVGILALVRFYSKKDNTFLFVGTGFFATGLLDGYHAIVTSSYFEKSFPSPGPSLIPWSWLASRLFLSILLWLSWLFWKREERLGDAGRISERRVYAIVAALSLMCFALFAFVPLPPAYFPRFIFPRPQEFVPAIFFLFALIGYLRKGKWKTDAFEHWLVLSIIVNFMSQAMFMSSSSHLYDMMFDAAHLLKKLSYICTLIGLMISMYLLFRTSEQSKEIIAESESRLRVIMESVQTGIVIIDPDTHTIVDVNSIAACMIGAPKEEVVGSVCHRFICPAEKGKCPITDLHQIVDHSERVLLTATGLRRPIIKSVTTVMLGGKEHLLESYIDITERKQMEEQLHASLAEKEVLVQSLNELAIRDGLTGLYNQRTFYVLLEEEFAREKRFKRPVSLLLLDIDHFKRVNDTYGHLAGDAILKGLSALLVRQARTMDRVCRYGGEEISVILPETGLEAATDVAERLRAAVETQPFDIETGAPISISVSIGVASWPTQAHSAQTLVAAADAAMYAAKQSGRNRVVRYEPVFNQPATQV